MYSILVEQESCLADLGFPCFSSSFVAKLETYQSNRNCQQNNITSSSSAVGLKNSSLSSLSSNSDYFSNNPSLGAIVSKQRRMVCAVLSSRLLKPAGLRNGGVVERGSRAVVPPTARYGNQSSASSGHHKLDRGGLVKGDQRGRDPLSGTSSTSNQPTSELENYYSLDAKKSRRKKRRMNGGGTSLGGV
jgi:hypothetical protein